MGVVVNSQIRGKFQCKKVYAQFGDSFFVNLPLFSGDYEIDPTTRRDWRPVYFEKASDSGSHFRYCSSERAWVFRPAMDVDEDCSIWAMKSPETSGFDLTEVDYSQWRTRKNFKSKTVYDGDYFLLVCSDCDETTCDGDCEDNQCVCRPGQYGRSCHFDDSPCERLDYDRRTQPFRGIHSFFGNLGLSSKYELLFDSQMNVVLAYDHPVYVRFRDKKDLGAVVIADVIINLGRRYVISYLMGNNTEPISLGLNQTVKEAVVAYFRDFNGVYDLLRLDHQRPLDLRPVYVSDPLDYGTASDTLSPIGLRWFLSQSVGSLALGPSVDTVLLCESCSEQDGSSSCGLWGNCEDTKCACDPGFNGPQCEGVESWCSGCSLSNGYCNGTLQQCVCFDGFEGDKCEDSLPTAAPTAFPTGTPTTRT